MKIRTDFVTNSSSTSYLISIDRDQISTKEDLKFKFIQRLFEGLFEDKIENKDQLDKWFEKSHSWGGKSLKDLLNDDYYKEKYERLLNMIQNENRIIMFIEIEYDDGHLSGIFESMEEEGIITFEEY